MHMVARRGHQEGTLQLELTASCELWNICQELNPGLLQEFLTAEPFFQFRTFAFYACLQNSLLFNLRVFKLANLGDVRYYSCRIQTVCVFYHYLNTHSGNSVESPGMSARLSAPLFSNPAAFLTALSLLIYRKSSLRGLLGLLQRIIKHNEKCKNQIEAVLWSQGMLYQGVIAELNWIATDKLGIVRWQQQFRIMQRQKTQQKSRKGVSRVHQLGWFWGSFEAGYVLQAPGQMLRCSIQLNV